MTYQLHFHGADSLNFTERGCNEIFSWRLRLRLRYATSAVASFVQTDDNVMIGGFMVEGTRTKSQ